MHTPGKTSRKSPHYSRTRLRGLSLLEAILALGIGGIVITQSILGLSEYTTGVQVQATASKVAMLSRATDRYAEDNYANLVSAAPQELPIDVLEPYFGKNIGSDAFGNTYKLTTRTYPITVPDPTTGGTKTEKALQVLLVGEAGNPASTPMDDELTLRSDIANTAGGSAGFISKDALTCSNPSGAPRPSGHICGAFGSYSFHPNAFPATNFAKAAIVSLITKGDSSVYGDQLYRYDYGDPELNTMHTDVFMEDNDIVDPAEITGANRIQLDAPNSVIETTDPANRLTVRSADSLNLVARDGRIWLNPSNNTVVIANNPVGPFPCAGNPCTGNYGVLRSENGKLRIDGGETVFGDRVVRDHGASELRVGSGNIWANIARLEQVHARAVNSLFQASNDALRLQRNRQGGEVIIGQRVRYNPDGNADAGIYEISDGELTAQHVQVQDITCADCGGSLSAILPKWRHMGTYFVPDGAARLVPKPNCGDNRRRTKVRAAIGNNLAYQEADSSDSRYEAKIILVPRQMAFSDNNADLGEINFRFDAVDVGPSWMTRADVTNGRASALAKTYCVFVGGNVDPTIPHGNLPSASSPIFNRIE